MKKALLFFIAVGGISPTFSQSANAGLTQPEKYQTVSYPNLTCNKNLVK